MCMHGRGRLLGVVRHIARAGYRLAKQWAGARAYVGGGPTLSSSRRGNEGRSHAAAPSSSGAARALPTLSYLPLLTGLLLRLQLTPLVTPHSIHREMLDVAPSLLPPPPPPPPAAPQQQPAPAPAANPPPANPPPPQQHMPAAAAVPLLPAAPLTTTTTTTTTTTATATSSASRDVLVAAIAMSERHLPAHMPATALAETGPRETVHRITADDGTGAILRKVEKVFTAAAHFGGAVACKSARFVVSAASVVQLAKGCCSVQRVVGGEAKEVLREVRFAALLRNDFAAGAKQRLPALLGWDVEEVCAAAGTYNFLTYW